MVSEVEFKQWQKTMLRKWELTQTRTPRQREHMEQATRLHIRIISIAPSYYEIDNWTSRIVNNPITKMFWIKICILTR